MLHLHGSVGWYEAGGTVQEHYQDMAFNETLGRPVVLYPDPDRDPTGDPIVQSMWRELEAALADATHVVVVGHSLHDPALVSKLASAAQLAQVVVGVYGREGDPAAGEEPLVADPAEVERALRLVPGRSAVLPIRFGPSGVADLSALDNWFQASK